MKTTFLSAIFFILAFTAFAEGKNKSKSAESYKKYLKDNPVWIQCIDSEHASYKFAIYAFETFWQGRPQPMGEEGDVEKVNEETTNKKLSPEEEKYNRYTYDYKRFLEWKHRVVRMLDGSGRVYTKAQMEEHFRIRNQGQ